MLILNFGLLLASVFYLRSCLPRQAFSLFKREGGLGKMAVVSNKLLPGRDSTDFKNFPQLPSHYLVGSCSGQLIY
jgi:hypothetical protein